MSRRVDVERGDATLAAYESGRGGDTPVVVLSNSLGASAEMWRPQRELLGRDYRVIGYDTRGHGRSRASAPPYSFDMLVDDALAVMDRLEVERAAFVGLSLGGMTGLGLALRAPERVSRLVCCAARADAPEAFRQSWDERVAAVRAGGMQAVWPATRDRWLTDTFRAQNPGAVSGLEREFVATAVDGFVGCAMALKGLDYLRHLAGMSVPTLYVAGAEDVAAPPQAMEAMTTATPTAEYHRVDGAAHIVNVNARETFDALLTDFLERDT